MSFTDFLKEVGDGLATGIRGTANFFNDIDPLASDVEFTKHGTVVHDTGPADVGLEAAARGLHWLRSNAISQPLSTADLMLATGPQEGDWGKLFRASDWAKVYHAAEHISPGQALYMTDAEASKAIDSPLLYASPPASDLPPGWKDLTFGEQQDFLKEAGMPAIGNRFVHSLQKSTSFNAGSGTADFAAAWFLDPLVLTGKGVGAVRRAKNLSIRPKGGRSEEDIAALMERSSMNRLKKFVWENKDNSQLLNNLPTVRNSSIGPRFGGIASLLKSEDEVHDFLLVSLGDVRAMDRLEASNTLAAQRFQHSRGRLEALGLDRTRYIGESNRRMAELTEREMTRIEGMANADEALVTRYDEILNHADELDRVNLSRWGFAQAAGRTEAQNAYRIGPARHGGAARERVVAPSRPFLASASSEPRAPISTGFVKSRVWGAGDLASTPVLMVRMLKEMRPNGHVALGDIDKASVAEVRGFVARIPGIREKTRAGLLDRYLKTTTEGERKSLLDGVGRLAYTKVAQKHGLDPEVGVQVYEKYVAKKLGMTDQLKRYSAAKKPGPDGSRIRVDEYTVDGTKVSLSPFTVSRIMENHLLPDLNVLDKVLSRHGSAIRALRESAPGNADWMLKLGDTFTQVWKFGTLARLGYIPRVLGDDLMSQVAALGSAAMLMRLGYGVKNGLTNAVHTSDKYFGRLNKLLLESRLAYVGGELNSAYEDVLGVLNPQAARLEEQWAGFSALARNQKRLALAPETGKPPVSPPSFPSEPVPSSIRSTRVGQSRHNRPIYHREDLGGFNTAAGEVAPAAFKGAKSPIIPAALRSARTPKAVPIPVTPPYIRATRVGRSRHGRPIVSRRTLGGFNIASPTAPGEAYKGVPTALLTSERIRFLRAERARLQAELDDAKTMMAKEKVIQGSSPTKIDGREFPGAFQGRRGEYALHRISADEAYGKLFESSKALIHGNLARSFDNGAEVITPAQDELLHLQAWTHALNAQMGQDALERLALQGRTPEELTSWLRMNPEGRAYHRRLGQKLRPPEDIAQSVWHEVAEYAPTPLIREMALKGEAAPDLLAKEIPKMAARPDMHLGHMGSAKNAAESAMDRAMRHFYRVAATIPANRLSRHPLYNQLYDGHLKAVVRGRAQQGVATDRLTVGEVDQMVEAAHRVAEKDMRRLVFDVTHRSDAAAALRMISPFFAATSESFQRWGKVIADRPEVVGYAANFFNAPLAMGVMQDADGNEILPDGTAWTIDPKTKKAVRRLVPKSERWIVTRMPKWFVESPLGIAFGVERASGNMALSQNSMNIVTQGDPWFNPGVGPIVAVPVNEWAKDKMQDAELARHLGILPFGPQQGTGLFGDNAVGRIASMVVPTTIKNFLTAFDTSDSRYQRIKLHIVQKAMFEHDNMGKPMPSRQEIADMTRNYWIFSALSAFSQPMATQRRDAYQFYRDQYNNLRRQDPLKADEKFLERFSEDYFIFAQAESRNVSGVQATKKAVALSKKYAEEIAAHPELAALIVGPEGNGPFSPEAYSYQLNTPLIPGGDEMQRTKISAEEAVKENQRRKGWADFMKLMNRITADMHGAGFASFEDPGAEGFKKMKSLAGKLYGDPALPGGRENPYYNEEWSKDFYTRDTKKYDRLIPGLTAVANSRLADEPHRSDLRNLRTYLEARSALNRQLAARKQAGGAGMLVAKSNADLMLGWAQFVDGLVESDVRFEDLHRRFLLRDMNTDVEDVLREAAGL